jgi:hypothetical protein
VGRILLAVHNGPEVLPVLPCTSLQIGTSYSLGA